MTAALTDKYFVGQGNVYIADRANGSTGLLTSGFQQVGDADSLEISISQDFIDHRESRTGNKERVVHVPNSTDVDFMMTIRNINPQNLARILYGEDDGATAGDTITGETLPRVYSGGMVPLQYPGITGTTVVRQVDIGGSVTATLVEDTDFTVDTTNGTITIVDSPVNVVGSEPFILEVDYTHSGIASKVEALVNNIKEYSVRFEAVNRADTDTPVFINIHRLNLELSENLSLISDEPITLTFKGALLPDDNQGSGDSRYFDIVQAT